MSASPDVSIVMPALDEQDNIRAAIDAALRTFDALGIDGEVLVVDDGSTDRTRALAEEARDFDARVRVLSHETRQGVGAAFWRGVDHAAGRTVCMLPGDNENDPAEILRHLPLLEETDVVVPFIVNRRARSAFRRALSGGYRRIINATFRTRFRYTNGTILWRRAALRELADGARDHSFFHQTDALVRLTRRGWRFAQVPCRLGRRGGGASKAVTWGSFLAVAGGYLRLVRDIYGARGATMPAEAGP